MLSLRRRGRRGDRLTSTTSDHELISPYSWWGSNSAIHNPKSAICSARRRLDLDVDARREAQLVERLDGLGGRLDNIDQTLVRANFKLCSRFLVDVRTTQHRVPLDPRGKRNRPVD